MDYFLGIDLGTSYFKAGIFDASGRLMGLGRQYVHKISDGTTCELPIDVFWKTIRDCLDEAIQKAGVTGNDIQSVSYSSQANSFILLDINSNPLTPLILWPDKRAINFDFPISDGFCKRTGLGIIPNHEFTIAKLYWFQKKQPYLWERTAYILSISDYLVFALTGQKICDYGTAFMTGLFDQTETMWWTQQLECLNIKREKLPIPERSGVKIGALTSHGAQLLGLSASALFCLGGLDHHMAAVGAGIPFSRNICESTGTVLACVNYVNGYFPREEVCIAPGFHENEYFQMTFDDNSAVTLEWYQRTHAPEYTISQLLEMATFVPSGCDGLTALSCASKYSGLSGFRTTKNIAYHHGYYTRAILESISRSLEGLIQKLKKEPLSAIIPTGGGGRSTLLIKIKAEKLGVNFWIPECTESACLGAALTAAAGIKNFGTLNDIIKSWVRIKHTQD